MKKGLIISLLMLILLLASSQAYEYRMSTNDSLTVSGKTVTINTIGLNGVVVSVSGQKSTIMLNDSQEFENLHIIPKSIFYVKETEGRYAIIDFCEKRNEVCNNIDDDCDGKIDDNVERDCGIGTGICTKGTQTCIEGEWGYCEGAVYPQEEICNEKDDDCDDKVDEELPKRACGNTPLTGACKNGVQECINGSWSECEGQVFPMPEDCNEKDDDCDGKIDEELTSICGVSDIGECTVSYATCEKGEWKECTAVMPAPEECDGLDNDCDGEIDEELIKDCGTSDVGECSFGVESCVEASWTECEGAVEPDTEWCDEKDDDCDGNIDNDCRKKGFFSKVFGWFKGLFS